MSLGRRGKSEQGNRKRSTIFVSLGEGGKHSEPLVAVIPKVHSEVLGMDGVSLDIVQRVLVLDFL